MNHITFFKNLKREYYYLLLLLCTVTYLSFTGLTNNCFWDDEAHVAFFAKNYVKTGQLTGYDGRNFYGIFNGGLLNKNLTTINPPLEYLVCALSFKLFGISTWAGRFLFVLFGIASLIIFFLLLKEKSFKLRWYSLILLAFSYSFLLNIRQCRYYSLVIFFSLLTYFFYKRFLSSQKIVNVVMLFISLFLLFESQYLISCVFAFSIGANHLLFHRRALDRQAWIKILIGCGCFGIIVMVLIFGFNILERPDIRHHYNFGGYIVSRFVFLVYYIRDLDEIGYISGFYIIIMILLTKVYRKEPFFPKDVFEWSCFIAIYVFFLSLFSPQLIEWRGIRNNTSIIRYMVVLLPFAAYFTGTILAIIHEKCGVLFTMVLLVITLTTNLFSFRMGTAKFRWLLPGYIKEIHSDYETPFEAAISYLEKNTIYNDTVYAVPEHMGLPLLFYLGDELKIGFAVRKDTKLPKAKLDTLKAPVFIDRYFPNLVVAFGLKKVTEIRMNFFIRGKYTYKSRPPNRLPYKERLGVFRLDLTRPELNQHSFSPVKKYNSDIDDIYIFERREKR